MYYIVRNTCYMPNIFVICSNDELSRCVYLTVFNSSIPEYKQYDLRDLCMHNVSEILLLWP